MLKVLLFPFAVLYDAITTIRNRLYDLGYKPAARFEIPIIAVGNLAVGGTGKTPMIEYLIRLLSAQFSIATLSRGYGRETRGIRIASSTDNALTLGDEPYQFYRKFAHEIVVAVGEERALAIPYILQQHPDTDIILMCDAIQHRKVKPSFQVLLTDCNNPFYKDFLLPAGTLRESAKGADRADIIIVTKCSSDISGDAMMKMEKAIRDYAEKPIFFTTIRYGSPIALGHVHPPSDRVILLSGIANHHTLEQYVAANYTLVRHFAFPDHHVYTDEDLRPVSELAAREKAIVLTTEKDAVKLDMSQLKPVISSVPFFYLPIQMEFLKNGKDFDEMVLNVLKQHGA